MATRRSDGLSSDRPVRWRAPGRVNLIGEHTDYNQGFVLPFAIDAGCTATVAAIAEPDLTIGSGWQPEPVVIALRDLRPGVGDWAGYAAGVVWALHQRGHPVEGLSIDIDSSVPVGSGLSSSAALVCSVATAVDDLLGLHLSGDDLLAVTRSAENDYVGAPTGGMDQLASLRCRADHALFCDMRSLEVEQVPFDLAAHDLTVLVVDTHASHSHADGEYRQRREGCERAAATLGVPALRDIELPQLDDMLARLPDDELRRYVRHVVTEDDRVLRTVELLHAGRVGDIGELLVASHVSMRDDYRITIPQLDVAVDTLMAAGALGARMTGGGFGGCVIALISTGIVEDAIAAIDRAYVANGFDPSTSFTVRPGQGAHRV